MRIKIILLLLTLILLLSSFSVVCLIEIYHPKVHTFEGKLMRREFTNKFTGCKLIFGIHNKVTIEEDINAYYNTKLYDRYIVKCYYGRISGKLKYFHYEKYKHEKIIKHRNTSNNSKRMSK